MRKQSLEDTFSVCQPQQRPRTANNTIYSQSQVQLESVVGFVRTYDNKSPRVSFVRGPTTIIITWAKINKTDSLIRVGIFALPPSLRVVSRRVVTAAQTIDNAPHHHHHRPALTNAPYLRASQSSPKAVASYDADYVFSLPADLRALAEEELRESDEVRRHALTAMREWLDQNPKIVKCRYDSSFLLRFLRAKKFSLPIVQQTLERYVMLREVFEDSVFTNVSLEEPNVADLLNRGLVFALPKRDPEGRRILLIRSKAIDPSKHTMRDVMRLFTITTDFLVEDEENQIRGFIYLVDAGGASMQMLTLATPKEAMRMIRNG